MAKSSTQTAVTGERPEQLEPFIVKYGAARLAFLTEHDPANLLSHLRAATLTAELKRIAHQCDLQVKKHMRTGFSDAEAETQAMGEVVRPESQIGGPILPDSDKKELATLLAAWKQTPSAKQFLAG